MKLTNKSVIVICLMIAMLTCGKAEEAAKATATNLVTEIQAIAARNGSQNEYSDVLKKYLDFDKISTRVLVGVKKKIRTDKGQEEADKAITEFLPKFIPLFTTYMIKKYTNPENIEKFKNMTFEMGRVDDNGTYFTVNTKFKPNINPSGSKQGDLEVYWPVGKSNSLIFDMVFVDAAASFFKNEQSEATAKFTGDLNALLALYQ